MRRSLSVSPVGLLVGCVLFGALMAVRAASAGPIQRALFAAMAFVALALVVRAVRKPSNPAG